MVISELALEPLPVIRPRPLPPLRQLGALAAAALLFLASIGAADAHAHLKSASPPVDGVVAAVSGEVTVTFTEKLEEKLSSLVVTDKGGRAVSTGAARLPAGSDGKTLAVTIPVLPAGTYVVQWTAASVDTHKTTGSFSFAVKP